MLELVCQNSEAIIRIVKNKSPTIFVLANSAFEKPIYLGLNQNSEGVLFFSPLLNLFFKLTCFYFYFLFLEREYVQVREMGKGRERERERERERISSRLHTQHGAQCRAQSHNPGIMTWADIKSRTVNHHPGAPNSPFFLINICSNIIALVTALRWRGKLVL